MEQSSRLSTHFVCCVSAVIIVGMEVVLSPCVNVELVNNEDISFKRCTGIH